ncbi:hypothetical protein [Streptosporangium sp. CA-115845]|uniref:hypothetical protein n=1 Tax=Streptosporangium sp. CA-115845 TaxID=3240071 RepID=UPI003D8DDE9C
MQARETYCGYLGRPSASTTSARAARASSIRANVVSMRSSPALTICCPSAIHAFEIHSKSAALQLRNLREAEPRHGSPAGLVGRLGVSEAAVRDVLAVGARWQARAVDS